MANPYLFFLTTTRKIRMKYPTATATAPTTRLLPTVVNTISNSILHQLIIIAMPPRPIKLTSLFQLRLGYAYVYFSLHQFLLVVSYRVRTSICRYYKLQVTSYKYAYDDVQIFICIVNYHFSCICFAHRSITWFISGLFHEPSSTKLLISRLFCEEAGLFSYACGDRDSDGDINGVDDGGSCCPAQWLLLANTMNALSVCIYFFFLVAGLIFDSIGGQWAAVLGCFVNASGFLILAVLLFTLQQDYDSISPIMETIIFCIAVILVDAGSICTNISFFSFLWHLPSHQALVLSLANCCLSVAALIPLVLRSILHRYWSVLSLPIVVGMYVGAIIVVAMPLCWVVVPSIDEYRSNAMNVLGVPIPHKSVRGIRGAIKNATAAVRIMQHHTHLHIYTMGACVFAWLSSFV